MAEDQAWGGAAAGPSSQLLVLEEEAPDKQPAEDKSNVDESAAGAGAEDGAAAGPFRPDAVDGGGRLKLGRLVFCAQWALGGWCATAGRGPEGRPVQV